MPILHMQTERVRTTGQQLSRTAQNVFDHASRLLNAARRLDANWDGGSSRSVVHEAHEITGRLKKLAEQLDSLSWRTIHEAEEWERVDSNGAQGFVETGKSVGLPGISSIFTSVTATVGAGFSILPSASDTFVDTSSLLSSVDDMGNIGRWGNHAAQLIRSVFPDAPFHKIGRITKYQGYAHKMPGAFQWLSQPVFKGSHGLLGKFTQGSALAVGIGTVVEGFETTSTEGATQAWTTALLSKVADWAIVAGGAALAAAGLVALGVVAAPAAGTAAVVIGLGYGVLTIGSKIYAAVTGSEKAAEFAQKIDISTHTDKLIDGVYDWFENAWKSTNPLAKRYAL